MRKSCIPAAAVALAAGAAAPAAVPSNPANFDIIYNIGTVPPGSMFDIPGAFTSFPQGGVVGSDTQLNVFDGGEISGVVGVGLSDQTGTNSEANIFGGLTGGFSVRSGGRVNLIDGVVFGSFNLVSGAVVNIAGGSVRTGTFLNTGSTLNISGGTFGLVGTLPALTAVGNSTINISAGAVGNRVLVMHGGEINISGGSVGNDMVIDTDFPGGASGVPTALNLSGGSIGENLEVRNGSGINISITGGSIGDNFSVETDPFRVDPNVFDISGGFVGDNFSFSEFANLDVGTFIMSGGSFGNNFEIGGVTAHISGGNVGSGVLAGIGSIVTFSGEAFPQFGGGSADMILITPNANGLATGVLADGSVYIFAGEASDTVFATIDTFAVAPSTNPGVLSSGAFNKGLRPGETLTVNGTGELGRNFAVVGATLNMENGSVGNGLEVAFGEVNITGGAVGAGVDAFNGSTVNISGGAIGDDFDAMIGSTINLFGTSFLLDGVELTDLVFGEAFTITTRDVTLSGLLADGSAFEFDLNSTNAAGADFFSTGATITVSPAVDECEGDTNGDNLVNFTDLNTVLSSFGMQGAGLAGDVNGDDIINFQDLNIVLSNFGAACN
ncbi:MAG: beta strand repeat-containing protein [Phycisphaerales bacterium]